MATSIQFVLRNGTILPRAETAVDIDDRGYQFGDGVYEVIRYYAGKPFLLEPHLRRLRRSAGEIGIPFPVSDDTLSAQFAELIAREGIRTGIVYIQLTRGVYPRIQGFLPDDVPPQLTAYVRALPRPEEPIREGVHAALVPDIRWLRCDIKSLNLLPNILARQKALDSHCYEAIQHRDGIVTEGSFSNVGIIAGGTLQTHPVGNLILNGITRTHLLGLCTGAGIPVLEKPFTVNQLLAADEVFITSTTNEVMPVVQINGTPLGSGKPGPVCRELQHLYAESFQAAV